MGAGGLTLATFGFVDGRIVVGGGVVEVVVLVARVSSFSRSRAIGVGVLLGAAVGAPSVGAVEGLLCFGELDERLTREVVKLHWVGFVSRVRVALGRPPTGGVVLTFSFFLLLTKKEIVFAFGLVLESDEFFVHAEEVLIRLEMVLESQTVEIAKEEGGELDLVTSEGFQEVIEVL